MKPHGSIPIISSRFPAWLADELRPEVLAKSLGAGFLIYILEIIVVISFTALIFSGELSAQLPYALGLLIVGDALLCAVVAVLSSYPGSIAVEQDIPSAILAVVAATILTALPPGATFVQQFSTVMVMVVGTAFVTGLFFLLLGVFKLGGLVRYLPYPVMGGFLAGTGWLLTTGGIGVMVNTPLSLTLLHPDMLLRWLPGVLLGAVMLLATSRFNSPLVLPGIFAAAAGLFHILAWISKTPLAQLSAQGWLLGPFPSGIIWQFPLNGEILSNTNWLVLLDLIPDLAPVFIVSVIALLLNTSGLELVIKKDIDLNRELVTAGVANMAAGFGGGFVGFHAISLSSLNHTMSGGKRLSGLITALLIGLTTFFGAFILTYIPRIVLGALIVFLGLSLLFEWLYRAWFKFSRIDFFIITLILGTIAARGFLEGIAIGLVLTIILFVVSYSQISVVKHVLSGKNYRSRVTRNPRQQKVLEMHGEQLYILKLQGYIFFGTANNLFEQVRDRFRQPGLPPVRFAVLDFSQVTGLDSTGLLSFSKLRQWVQEQQLTLILTGLHDQALERFVNGGFSEMPDVLRFFPDLDHGIEWCENQIIAAAQKDQDPEKSLPDHLRGILPAAGLVEKLIQHMEKREIPAGEYLIRQGDSSDLIFFIETGQVTAQLEAADKAPMRLETMRGGRTVGEIGFYLGTKRTAAVITDEPSTIYYLSRQTLELIERTDPEAAYGFHRMIVHLLGERVIHLTEAVDALQR